MWNILTSKPYYWRFNSIWQGIKKSIQCISCPWSITHYNWTLYTKLHVRRPNSSFQISFYENILLLALNLWGTMDDFLLPQISNRRQRHLQLRKPGINIEQPCHGRCGSTSTVAQDIWRFNMRSKQPANEFIPTAYDGSSKYLTLKRVMFWGHNTMWSGES
jgi:hypothetical protein